MLLSVEVINIFFLNYVFFNYKVMIYIVGLDCFVGVLVLIIFLLYVGCIYIFMKDRVV